MEASFLSFFSGLKTSGHRRAGRQDSSAHFWCMKSVFRRQCFRVALSPRQTPYSGSLGSLIDNPDRIIWICRERVFFFSWEAFMCTMSFRGLTCVSVYECLRFEYSTVTLHAWSREFGRGFKSDDEHILSSVLIFHSPSLVSETSKFWVRHYFCMMFRLLIVVFWNEFSNVFA